MQGNTESIREIMEWKDLKGKKGTDIIRQNGNENK